MNNYRHYVMYNEVIKEFRIAVSVFACSVFACVQQRLRVQQVTFLRILSAYKYARLLAEYVLWCIG